MGLKVPEFSETRVGETRREREIDNQLRRIAARALFLSERSYPPRLREPGHSGAMQNRMESWKRYAAGGDTERFERRLRWDDFDENAIAGLTESDPATAEVAVLPPWTSILRDFLLLAQDFDFEAAPFVRSEEPVPFEHVFAPLVAVACSRVRETSVIDASALHQLQRHLLASLCGIAGETLLYEFAAFRSSQQVFIRAGVTTGLPDRIYRSFIRRLLSGGLIDLFGQYPVLARFLSTVANHWCTGTNEFLDRLEADQSLIRSLFNRGLDPGAVTRIEAGLSDRHAGGRTTLRVTFESGLSLLYKPKSIDSEAAWYKLLEFLNRQPGVPDFRIFPVLPRNGYGWAAEVPQLPCTSESEVKRYFDRAGMLLCLLYALEASDCHRENIIASGEYPVLIDMETLLQHRAFQADSDRTDARESQENANSLANRLFYWDSVFRTAFLPRWEFGINGESYDISGLGGASGQATSFQRKLCRFPNTDLMSLREDSWRTQPARNVVRLQSAEIAPEDYTERIVEGFTRMYHVLARHESQLLAPGGPISAMSALRVRFVFRNTRIYQSVLNSLLTPRALRDGVEAELRTEVLARPFLHSDKQPVSWPLLASERRALLDLDVPIFSARADSRTLELHGAGPVEEYFDEPSFDLVIAGFLRRGEDDLVRQTGFIRSSFPRHRETAVARQAIDFKTALAEPVSADRFIAEALGIGKRIRETAIISRDGSATWVSPGYHAAAGRWQLQPMRPRLYDGDAGVALFLAALAAVTGERTWRELAMAAVRNSVGLIHNAQFQQVLSEPGIGAGVGIGSLAYSLAACGSLLGDGDLFVRAEEVAVFISDERIFSDRRFDLMGGSAGAILALLALYRRSGSASLLDRAKVCGEHLLASRRPSAGSYRVWASPEGAFLTGFSHGAAGIAASLAMLFSATQNADFLDAAAEACQWESAVFVPENKNWPDFRHTDSTGQVSWCHGAAGIGLGRLAGLPALDTPAIRADIMTAAETTIACPEPDLDHLCCGHLGRAEFLLRLSQVYGQPDWARQSREIAARTIQRAHMAGRFHLGFDSCPHIPSLHQGEAGIGYQLLRLAAPDRVPSVLLWE